MKKNIPTLNVDDEIDYYLDGLPPKFIALTSYVPENVNLEMYNWNPSAYVEIKELAEQSDFIKPSGFDDAGGFKKFPVVYKVGNIVNRIDLNERSDSRGCSN